MRQIKRITGIEGVATGAPARVKLTVNRRYHGLTFFTTLAGVATAVGTIVGRVRLYVGGLPIWDVPAAYLLAAALREGRTLAVGELPLDFSDPSRADKIDEQVTAWDLFGETSFEVELEILPDLVGAVGLTGVQEFDYGQSLVNGKPLKQVRKIFTIAKNAAAGLNDVDNIPVRDAIQRLTFVAASLPTEFWVDADGNRVLEATAAQLVSLYAKHGHAAQAGSNTIRFDYTERIDDFLIVKQNLNVRFSVAAAGAVTIMVEALAPGFM